MRTLIDINDDLLKEAMRIAGVRTKKETVQRALEEFIKSELRHELKEMAGSGAVSMSQREIKKLRHKRGRLHEGLSSKTR